MTNTHTAKDQGAQSAHKTAAHAGAHHAAVELADDERKEIARAFKDVVNMTPAAFKKWLDSADSKRVGFKGESSESVGHQSGLHIIEILGKPAKELDDDDYRHMRKVVGYVHRHMAQGPSKQDVESSDWRYSLMNWGHDPLKK